MFSPTSTVSSRKILYNEYPPTPTKIKSAKIKSIRLAPGVEFLFADSFI